MLRGILKILVIIGLVVGGTFLIPDNIKKNVASKLGGAISNALPRSVKEKMEPVVFSPAERRQKLLDQLEKNIESIKAGLAKPADVKKSAGEKATSNEEAAPKEETPEEIVKKLEETKKIIEEIRQINNDAGVINKVTTKIYKTIIGGDGTETTETCSREAKS